MVVPIPGICLNGKMDVVGKVRLLSGERDKGEFAWVPRVIWARDKFTTSLDQILKAAKVLT